ncbi:hypothetical protein N784_14235 [Pontibacillus litoralis JSM 072002]|uniref:Alpha/beta hydrolase n=1 Tax=Pontibacillus litoralis JSM 072002 TaxID=1385512 RepID=A0A0A5G6X5_9BACI|nr:hypothetical protein N784_14235 [Pontibacillus litoralis JSM 072002]
MTEEFVEDFGVRASYKELVGCGHSPMIDDLDQVIKAMEDFFRDN